MLGVLTFKKTAAVSVLFHVHYPDLSCVVRRGPSSRATLPVRRVCPV